MDGECPPSPPSCHSTSAAGPQPVPETTWYKKEVCNCDTFDVVHTCVTTGTRAVLLTKSCARDTIFGSSIYGGAPQQASTRRSSASKCEPRSSTPSVIPTTTSPSEPVVPQILTSDDGVALPLVPDLTIQRSSIKPSLCPLVELVPPLQSLQLQACMGLLSLGSDCVYCLLCGEYIEPETPTVYIKHYQPHLPSEAPRPHLILHRDCWSFTGASFAHQPKMVSYFH